jgi:hypothetical protein
VKDTDKPTDDEHQPAEKDWDCNERPEKLLATVIHP